MACSQGRLAELVMKDDENGVEDKELGMDDTELGMDDTELYLAWEG